MRELLQQALNVIKKSRSGYGDNYHTEEERTVIAALEAELAKPEQKSICRDDGRCQYAIDHGAEGLGHCPTGKCCMPLPQKLEPEQEPVVEVQSFGEKQVFVVLKPLSDGDKLYTSPPRKEWVGLTDKEEIELDEKTWLDINAYLEARDAKLKEKNNAV